MAFCRQKYAPQVRWVFCSCSVLVFEKVFLGLYIELLSEVTSQGLIHCFHALLERLIKAHQIWTSLTWSQYFHLQKVKSLPRMSAPLVAAVEWKSAGAYTCFLTSLQYWPSMTGVIRGAVQCALTIVYRPLHIAHCILNNTHQCFDPISMGPRTYSYIFQ